MLRSQSSKNEITWLGINYPVNILNAGHNFLKILALENKHIQSPV